MSDGTTPQPTNGKRAAQVAMPVLAAVLAAIGTYFGVDTTSALPPEIKLYSAGLDDTLGEIPIGEETSDVTINPNQMVLVVVDGEPKLRIYHDADDGEPSRLLDQFPDVQSPPSDPRRRTQ